MLQFEFGDNLLWRISWLQNVIRLEVLLNNDVEFEKPLLVIFSLRVWNMMILASI